MERRGLRLGPVWSFEPLSSVLSNSPFSGAYAWYLLRLATPHHQGHHVSTGLSGEKDTDNALDI